jgi:4-oxalmesaconate hydratase
VIIDAHAHLVTPMSVMGIRSFIQVSNGQHSIEWLKERYLDEADLAKQVKYNIDTMDKVGTDIQILSPRPFTLMHSHHRFEDIATWIALQNDLIHDVVTRHPDRFLGMAGLPQMGGKPLEIVFNEIDRCLALGFVGILINPDPSEGAGTSPPLGDAYWHPLWEKMTELDIPALVHSAGCCGRESYDEHFSSEESLAITSISHSDVFSRFPTLKLIIAHGGGAIPYQIGRWRSHWAYTQAAKKPAVAEYYRALEAAAAAGDALPPQPAELETFDAALKKFYFDTVFHDDDSLRHLIRKVGADRCLFGTERPGSGGGIDLETGRPLDDMRYKIDRMEFLSDQEKDAIYRANAARVFPRIPASMTEVK